MKIFKLVRPKSLSDPDYESFEYLLRWIGRDGSDYLYMFYDAEFEIKITANSINELDPERLQSLVTKVGQSVTLQADDLSQKDLKVVSQLLENKYVTRIFKSGDIERYAPDSNSFKFRLMDGRYSIDFKLVLADVKTWK